MDTLVSMLDRKKFNIVAGGIADGDCGDVYKRQALYEGVYKVKALPRAARVRADHSALCYGVLAQTFDKEL